MSIPPGPWRFKLAATVIPAVPPPTIKTLWCVVPAIMALPSNWPVRCGLGHSLAKHRIIILDLVYLDLGGTVVELISYEGGAVDPAPQTEHLGYRMMALEVDDMQKTADYLRTKGVEIVWGPRVRETYSRAEICDPNGYHIELRQWFR